MSTARVLPAGVDPGDFAMIRRGQALVNAFAKAPDADGANAALAELGAILPKLCAAEARFDAAMLASPSERVGSAQP